MMQVYGLRIKKQNWKPPDVQIFELFDVFGIVLTCLDKLDMFDMLVWALQWTAAMDISPTVPRFPLLVLVFVQRPGLFRNLPGLQSGGSMPCVSFAKVTVGPTLRLQNRLEVAIPPRLLHSLRVSQSYPASSCGPWKARFPVRDIREQSIRYNKI